VGGWGGNQERGSSSTLTRKEGEETIESPHKSASRNMKKKAYRGYGALQKGGRKKMTRIIHNRLAGLNQVWLCQGKEVSLETVHNRKRV